MPHPKKKHPPRPWKQAAAIACALAAIVTIAAIFRDTFAECLGYAATVTETTTAPGDTTATVKEIATSSPGGRFLRDFIIALAVVIGMMIAGVRSYASFTESKTAESRLLNERFAAAAELMAKETANGNPAIAARIGGIYIMEELANSNPARFLRQAVINLIAYIKDNAQLTAKPPLKEGQIPDAPRLLGEDVKAAFAVIDNLLGKSKNSKLPLNLPAGILDFSWQDFSHLDLSEGQAAGWRWFDWKNTDLQGVHLRLADLRGANFTGADMHGVNLSGAKLGGASLCYAGLQGANLDSASLQNPPTDWNGAYLQWAKVRAYLDVKNWNVDVLATDFSESFIKKAPTQSEGDFMMGKIWHSKQPELQAIWQQPFNNWRLDEIPSTSALVGAFWNFSARTDPAVCPRAKNFRKAAVELLKSGKLPPDFPDGWRKWLEKVSKSPDFLCGQLEAGEPQPEKQD